MPLSDAERKQKQRWFERGYRLEAGPPVVEPRNRDPFVSYAAAWANGVWQRHADDQAQERQLKRASLKKKEKIPAPR